MGAAGSPLKLFALMVLVCNAVFAIAASAMKNLDAFIYTIHMFLGIVAAFVAIALWSPRSLYHPRELSEIRDMERNEDGAPRLLPPERPGVATGVLLCIGILYAIYQLIKIYHA
jgi:hypothetical protein